MVEPSDNIYIEKFIYRHEHPADAGVYDIIYGVHEFEGIFLTLLLYFLQIANILDDFMEGIDDIVDEAPALEDLATHPLSVEDYSI